MTIYSTPHYRVNAIAYHRNGICGAPFHVAIVTTSDDPAHTKVAVVFDEPHHVAVLDISKLASGIIAFRENSYRGDNFEPTLRKAISQLNAETDAIVNSTIGDTSCN